MQVRTYKFVVLSRPAPGREEECNDWYQNVHLGQVVAIPGIRSAQRFRLSSDLGARGAWPYLAIYEIETDNLDAVVQEIHAKAGSELLLISEALDTAGAFAAIYEEAGPVVTPSEANG